MIPNVRVLCPEMDYSPLIPASCSQCLQDGPWIHSKPDQNKVVNESMSFILHAFNSNAIQTNNYKLLLKLHI